MRAVAIIPTTKNSNPAVSRIFQSKCSIPAPLTASRLAHSVADFYTSFCVRCPPLIGNRRIRLLLHLPHYIVRVAQQDIPVPPVASCRHPYEAQVGQNFDSFAPAANT